MNMGLVPTYGPLLLATFLWPSGVWEVERPAFVT
jgi:hypothetical protein